VDAGVNAPSPLERRGDILDVRRNMGLNSRYQSVLSTRSAGTGATITTAATTTG